MLSIRSQGEVYQYLSAILARNVAILAESPLYVLSKHDLMSAELDSKSKPVWSILDLMPV